MPWYDFLLGRPRAEDQSTHPAPAAPAAHPAPAAPAAENPPVVTDPPAAEGPEPPRSPSPDVVLHNLVTAHGEPAGAPPEDAAALVGGDAFVFLTNAPDGPVYALAGLADPEGAWRALTEAEDRTGLVPVLLVGAVGQDHYFGDEGPAPDGLGTAEVLTTWKGRAGASQLTQTASALPRTEVGSALVALVPTREPWRVLHLLGYRGPANYGLTSGELAAVHRAWFQDFGARVFSIDEANLELVVEHPPHQPSEIARVARELFAVDPDQYAHLPSAAKVAATRRWPLGWD